MDPKLFTKTLIQIAIARRSCYTSRARTQKPSLYSKLSPLGNPKTSVVPELDDWVHNGNKLRVAELQRIVHDLRKRKRFTQALQVSEWMNKKGVCIFSPSEHAVQLDLIGKVHGFHSAESYFNKLKDQDKTDKTYGALLNCYVRQRQIEKSLSHLQKMKEMGFVSSPLTYNDIMCLYTNVGQHEKVPDVLMEMKENNVSPDNFSYRICINSYGVRSDLEGMEKILKEMECQPHIVMDWNTYTVAANFYIKAGLTNKAIDALENAEKKLDKKDGLGYNHLISLYSSIGKKDKVLTLWGLEKSDCKRCINRDFINMLESLVRLGELEDAENVLKEWESSGNCYDFRVPNTVIIGYSERGLCEKAEAILVDLMEKGKATTPNSWSIVAAKYLDKGEMERALECLKAALSLHVEKKGWKPNLKVITGILSWLGDKGTIGDVDHGSLPLLSVFPLSHSHNLTHILTDPATQSQVSSPGVSMENVAIVKGDKLILRGLKFHGYHGVKPEERKLGQKFLVDVDAWLDLQPAGKSDCLSDTISYTDIYRIVKEVVEGPAHNLLESVAQLIASTTFTKHPQISAIRVVVGKPHVAVPGSVDYLGVEILRYRSVDASN